MTFYGEEHSDVDWPAAEEAAEYARAHPRLAVCLHIDLGEWVCRDGTWAPLYNVVPQYDAAAVAGEVEQLFEQFEQADDDDRQHEIAHQICKELMVHAMLEEEIFYPACRSGAGDDEAGGAVRGLRVDVDATIGDHVHVSVVLPLVAEHVTGLEAYLCADRLQQLQIRQGG